MMPMGIEKLLTLEDPELDAKLTVTDFLQKYYFLV
jgi:hypothetical protein